ncbi:MAG TPA: 50S ribosomal protein L19 [Candidatus Portnoybacteria bacterium]|nr:50S ribosomal protein L19 [Candidatus Portnoybacteria bacterium]
MATNLEQNQIKQDLPKLRSGQTVKVYQEIRESKRTFTQIFEGLVLAIKHGYGLSGTFIVRKKASGGVGVEKTFPFHSPLIKKIEIIKQAKVRRAKLYFMRKRFGKSARLKIVDKKK